MFKLLYLCMAGGILLFSVIVVNIAPSINNLNSIQYYSQLSCKYFSDIYKKSKDDKDDDLIVDQNKRQKNRCERGQAMVGLEFAALNCNLVFGFICALLGFFLFFNIGDVGKITSFAGLGAGVVGFVLTFVYVIESGLIFNDVSGDNIPRISSDGSWAEWDDSKKVYKCKYFNKKNPEVTLLRYSNYGNKYLNYNKDIYFQENKYDEVAGCTYQVNYNNNYGPFNGEGDDDYPENRNLLRTLSDSSYYSFCLQRDENNNVDGERFTNSRNSNKCDKLYYYSNTPNNKKKVIYDRWLTTIILSCFIMLLDIGLAVFGFLVMNSSKGTGL